MKYSIAVEVTLREGIADPQGATIERALPALGFSGVSDVRAGKLFLLQVEAGDEEGALATATALAGRLLSNPVIEDARVRVIDTVAT